MTHGPSEYIYIEKRIWNIIRHNKNTAGSNSSQHVFYFMCYDVANSTHQHNGTLMSQTHLDETTRIPVFDITDKRTL
jgi:hypothetical protein